ncbi:hypothetical protein DEO72_LG8g1899 [Vigna unguiculata]|uniref:Uncharacterized protein n=1 Tax=Vigna unguiculata TaxID=3917 RepID=A0A4D6MQQ9_VIGUN|nr:hypothetical protein DEO72_LG8g1899 [Vigna unguiculata]
MSGCVNVTVVVAVAAEKMGPRSRAAVVVARMARGCRGRWCCHERVEHGVVAMAELRMKRLRLVLTRGWKVGSRMGKRWRRDRGMTEADRVARVIEDGGRCPCECNHDVVVVAGRTEKTKKLRTTSATTVTVFSCDDATGWLRSGLSSDGRT